MSEIKRRIIEFIEKEGIAKESFYKKIGMTSASFRGTAKNTRKYIIRITANKYTLAPHRRGSHANRKHKFTQYPARTY